MDDKNRIIQEKRGFTERSLNMLLQKICDYEQKQEKMKQGCSVKKVAAPLIKTMYVRDSSRFQFQCEKFDKISMARDNKYRQKATEDL